jgi:hypothetical protein
LADSGGHRTSDDRLSGITGADAVFEFGRVSPYRAVGSGSPGRFSFILAGEIHAQSWSKDFHFFPTACLASIATRYQDFLEILDFVDSLPD